MKITFVSNYMNHHQEAVALRMHKMTGGSYNFVACTPFDEKRLKSGYEDMNKKYAFIVRPYEGTEDEEKATELMKQSDVVIFGSAEEKYFIERMKTKKLTFRYLERPLKRGVYTRFIPILTKRIYDRYIKWKNDNLYVLCASAYTASDLKSCGFPTYKCYKWGYFPPIKCYDDINEVIRNKKKASLLWVGRFLDWKHPEKAIYVAEKLKNDKVDFQLTMVGDGKEREKIEKMIRKKNLTDCVTLTGSVPSNDVRKYMEDSQIFLFTSDFNEGWGAVLNEAMNSGCACVASYAIGAAPFLIQDAQNGYLYKNGDIDDLYLKVKKLLDDKNEQKRIAKNAYYTMSEMWNPDTVTERFMNLVENLLAGNECDLYESGVCSKSEIFKNNWYKK